MKQQVKPIVCLSISQTVGEIALGNITEDNLGSSCVFCFMRSESRFFEADSHDTVSQILSHLKMSDQAAVFYELFLNSLKILRGAVREAAQDGRVIWRLNRDGEFNLEALGELDAALMKVGLRPMHRWTKSPSRVENWIALWRARIFGTPTTNPEDERFYWESRLTTGLLVLCVVRGNVTADGRQCLVKTIPAPDPEN
ncbi:MAG: hypothetical protein WCT02_01580 [Candidatus Paceibacterota bacterium]